MISIARTHSANVKNWQNGTMALRWCAAGMIEAGKQFRRVNGHLHLPALRTALPRIQSALAASPEQIAWVLTSYLIAGAIGTPLSGWLADRFGRARIMALSVGVFTLASLGCGLSWNLEVLVVFCFF